MSKQILEYKGFQGSVDFSLEDNILYGKILHIDDLVSYDADSVAEVFEAFKEAVDDYLKMCEETGKAPNKPFSGTFNVRIGVALHRELAKQATREAKSINDVVRESIECHLYGRHQEIHHHYESAPSQTFQVDFVVREAEQARRVHLRAVQ